MRDFLFITQPYRKALKVSTGLPKTSPSQSYIDPLSPTRRGRMPGSHFNTVPVPYRLKHTHCIYHYLFSSFTCISSLEQEFPRKLQEGWKVQLLRGLADEAHENSRKRGGGSGEQGALRQTGAAVTRPERHAERSHPGGSAATQCWQSSSFFKKSQKSRVLFVISHFKNTVWAKQNTFIGWVQPTVCQFSTSATG